MRADPSAMSNRKLSEQLGRFFREPGGCTVIRRDRHKIIMRCIDATTGGSLFIKVYRQERLLSRLRETLGRSRGEHEHLRCERLRELGIPVPAPLGFAADRGGLGLVQQSLYAAEWMEGRGSLRDLAVELFRLRPVDPNLMRALSESLGRFIAGLHAAGVKAYDLNAGNFLVRRAADGSFDVVLVDYEQITFSACISRRRKIGNLAQVSAFLLPLSEQAFEVVCAGYLSAGGKDDRGDLVRIVGARARELAAQWERRLDDRFRRIGEQRSSR
ncbi:MAG: lipopolysaccharide kinase InaA family protein [Nitrospirota bacterium]